MTNQPVPVQTGVTAVVPLNSVQDLQALGAILAQSRMFGADTNPAQGVVIAGMCQQEGMSWSKWSQTYNLIHGQVSKRTDAMLADFQRMGGRHKVIRRDSEGAVVEFRFEDTVYTSSCIWQDLKDEPFVKSPKGGLKDKYATPRSRMQMLWARAVSDGLRVVCPMCCAGVYTPEETEDFAAPPPSYDAPQAAPVAPVAPMQTMQTIEVASAEVAPAIDASVCPIPGKLLGKPWSEMTDALLTTALSLPPDKAPALTDAHREAIRAELARRMTPAETTPTTEETENV